MIYEDSELKNDKKLIDQEKICNYTGVQIEPPLTLRLKTHIKFCLIIGSVGSTNMNERSSRSHAIFSITVECSEKGPDGQHHVRMGKLHLVDLAVSYYNVSCATCM